MDEGVVQKLIEFVENASPVVWNAAVKQVQMNALAYGIVATIFLFFGLALAYICYRIAKDIHNHIDTYEGGDWTMGCFSAIALATTIGLATEVAMRLMNPTWYAIEKILSFIP